MRRFLIAMRIFFRTLLDAVTAQQVEQVLRAEALPQPSADKQPALPEAAARPRPPAAPRRSDALTLLAALQREARFLDLVKEPLNGYSDAQVGAAAREVLRGCAAVLERLFAIEPILSEEEGAEVEIPAGFDAGRYRLTGNISGQPPFRGRLVHHGWQATKCELPIWSGGQDSTRVVAAAEVELK